MASLFEEIGGTYTLGADVMYYPNPELPEGDAAKNFVANLIIQDLARELSAVANEHGGKLQNRAVFFCDELGTMPPFNIPPLSSAGRSRRLTLVPII